MKYLKIFTLTLTVLLISSEAYAGRGCCSWHGGVSHCDSEVGRLVCSDSTYSPSCGCPVSLPNPVQNEFEEVESEPVSINLNGHVEQEVPFSEVSGGEPAQSPTAKEPTTPLTVQNSITINMSPSAEPIPTVAHERSLNERINERIVEREQILREMQSGAWVR